MFGIGAIEFSLLAILLGGSSVTTLGTPLPEDPLMYRVAPEEPLAYVTWSGSAAPDAKSENQTEQLMAEPEVKALIAGLEAAIRDAFNRNLGKQGPVQAVLAKNIPDLVKLVMTRPTAIYVDQLVIQPGGPPDIQAGLILNLGVKPDVTVEKLKTILKLAGLVAEKGKIEGNTYYRYEPKGGPVITWGVTGKYLRVGIGKGEIANMLQREKTDAPDWLLRIKGQLKIERTASLGYLNVQKIIELAASADRRGQIASVIKAMGLDNVTSVAGVTGLDKKGAISRTLLGIDGESQGIFKLFDGKPLSAEDVATIPADATIAAAARKDLGQVYEVILDIVGSIDPRTVADFEQGLDSFKRQTDVDVREDLLKSIGDVWTVYNSPGEGGFILTGLTATVTIRDRVKLVKAHDKLLAFTQKMMARDANRRAERRSGRKDDGDSGDRPTEEEFEFKKGSLKKPAGPANVVLKNSVALQDFDKGEEPEVGQRMVRYDSPRIKKLRFKGHDIYYLLSVDREFPFAPAWCITEKHLVISLFPQGVKEFLSRGKNFQSIAQKEEVAALLKSDGGPLGFVYYDSQQLFKVAYPAIQIGGQMLTGELQREGVDLDIGLLPSASSISKHLRPGIISITRTKAGIEMTSQHSLPGASGAILPVAMAAAFVMPYSAKVSEKARSKDGGFKREFQKDADPFDGNLFPLLRAVPGQRGNFNLPGGALLRINP